MTNPIISKKINSNTFRLIIKFHIRRYTNFIVKDYISFTVINNPYHLAIRITLIVSAVLVLILAGLYGIIGFALLLPAGIIAWRKKDKPVGETSST
jgi:hypothetical protein